MNNMILCRYMECLRHTPSQILTTPRPEMIYSKRRSPKCKPSHTLGIYKCQHWSAFLLTKQISLCSCSSGLNLFLKRGCSLNFFCSSPLCLCLHIHPFLSFLHGSLVCNGFKLCFMAICSNSNLGQAGWPCKAPHKK